MMRRLLPCFRRRVWSGSAPTGEGDEDASGVSYAASWRGRSIEIVLAREDEPRTLSTARKASTLRKEYP